MYWTSSLMSMSEQGLLSNQYAWSKLSFALKYYVFLEAKGTSRCILRICLFIYSYSFILRIWFDVLRYFRLIGKCVLSTLHTPHYIWPNEYILLLKQDVLMTACVFLPLCASSSCSYGQRPSIPLCIFWLSLKCSWTGFCLRTCLLPAAHVLSLR